MMSYPDCDSCPSTEMTHVVLSVTRCDHLDHEWGEDGVGFVVACPKCKRLKLSFTSI